MLKLFIYSKESKTWEDAPKFRTLKLSQLIDEKDKILKSKMYLKVNLDIDITYEEANFLKETFMSDYDIREISLIQEKVSLESTTAEIIFVETAQRFCPFIWKRDSTTNDCTTMFPF